MDIESIEEANGIRTVLIDIYVRMGIPPKEAIERVFYPQHFKDDYAGGLGMDKMHEIGSELANEIAEGLVMEKLNSIPGLNKETKEKLSKLASKKFRDALDRKVDKASEDGISNEDIADLVESLEDAVNGREKKPKKESRPKDVADYFKIIDRINNDEN